MSYGCDKCGGVQFEVQMRMVIVSIGPAKELQARGIVPVRVCTSEKCDGASVPTHLQILDAVPLIPAPNAPRPTLDDEKMKKVREAIEKEGARLEARTRGKKAIKKPPVGAR